METKSECGEVEIIVTAEITYLYNGRELANLVEKDLLPDSAEALAALKRDVANDVTAEIIEHLDADHVSVISVQYFEKDRNAPAKGAETEVEWQTSEA